jgi:hypothetical protein
MSGQMSLGKTIFEGIVKSVKARIRLIRSFDQIQHACLGYVLVLEGAVEGKPVIQFKVAIGEKTHLKHRFRIGDEISGEASPVEYPKSEWAEYYRVSGLKIIQRGPDSEERPPDPLGGIAPALAVYRSNGHLRLDAKTYEPHCRACPWGLVMATEIILDQWNPDKKQWRYETHCYGPKDCRFYRPGRARVVQGRKPGMKWIDDDYERANEDMKAGTKGF